MQGTIPAPAKGRTRLLITDDIIDQLGHDDELELLGSTIALERYRDVVIRLRDAGWRRILVVTDHGFIHWPGSDEKRATPPIAGPVYRSRRVLAYPASIDLPGPYALSLGGQLKILPARGASCWSAYGGLGYFHGGASLQEWVIPCIKIEWPQTAQPVNVIIQPLEHVLSVRPRVIVHVERESMFIEDALPRHIEIVIRHGSERRILFRSAQTEITPSQDQVAISLRMTPGADAPWDTPLQIEVRDALTEEVLTTTDSVLRARLDEW